MPATTRAHKEAPADSPSPDPPPSVSTSASTAFTWTEGLGDSVDPSTTRSSPSPSPVARASGRARQPSPRAREAADAAIAADAVAAAKARPRPKERIPLCSADGCVRPCWQDKSIDADGVAHVVRTHDFCGNECAANAGRRVPRSPQRDPSPIRETSLSLVGVGTAIQDGTLSTGDAIAVLRGLITTSPIDDIPRIEVLLRSLADDRRAESAEAPRGRDGLGPAIAGKLTALWSESTVSSARTLFLTESVRPTVSFDINTGLVAEMPASKPITNAHVLHWILHHFQDAALTAGACSPEDALQLGLWVSERMYTGSRVDALECSVRRLLFHVDTGAVSSEAPSLSDVIRSRAEFVLQAETIRFGSRPKGPTNTPDAGRSGRSQPRERQQQQRSSAPPSGDFCFNWARGLQCSERSKVNGVCRFSHICGKDLGGGRICRESHRQADHQ
jgi:hypothetical protein